MDNDLRATIEANINAAEESVASADSTPTPETASTTATTEASAPETTSGDTTSLTAAQARARDASGKFAKAKSVGKSSTPSPKQGAESVSGSPASPGSAPPPGAELGAASVAPPVEAIKPPPSLTAAEREHFAKAPPEIQKMVARLEYDAQKPLREAAQARKFAQEFSQNMEPYAQMLGQNPVGAIRGVLDTVRQLQTGHPAARAKIIGDLIRTYQPDMKALVEHVDNPAQPQPQPYDPEAIIRQAEERFEQRFRQRQAQALERNAHQHIEKLRSSGDFEFLDQVRPTMAALIDSATAQEMELSIEDAYNQAVWANPKLRAIVQQREQAKSVATAQAATQRASTAGLSVKNQPASPVNGAKAGDLRSDIHAAISRLSGR